jgi:glutathione S-transferase
MLLLDLWLPRYSSDRKFFRLQQLPSLCCVVKYNSPVAKLTRPSLFQKKPTNPIIADDLREKLSPKLDVYDKILSKQKYMAGDEFSLIDIFYMPYTELLYQAGEGKLIDDRSHVKEWWERVSSRESWKKIISG